MQSPHHAALNGQRMIVLHEFQIHAQCRQVGFVIGLRKKSPVIPTDSRHDQLYVRNLRLHYLQGWNGASGHEAPHSSVVKLVP